MTSQTARDRVLAAVSGEEVWPVPSDVFGNNVYPRLEAELRSRLGIVGQPHEAFLRALSAHVRWGKIPYIGPAPEQAPPHIEPVYPYRAVTRNIWGTWDGIESYFEGIERPLANIDTVAQVEAYPWPSADLFDYTRIGWETFAGPEFLPAADWAARHADVARLVGPDWSPVFSRIMDLCGMETGLMHIAARPDLIEALVACIGAFLEDYYGRLAAAAEGHADFLRFSDDFASQQGLMLSPARWRQYFLPLWRRLFAIAHAHGLRPWMHSCGSVRTVLGDLVDAGLEVLETVQVHCTGMDAAELKREFGASLTFYGGVDTQHIMTFGTPEAVRNEVRRLADILGRGGRYILTSSHTLLDDTPAENVLAMHDEANRFRS